MVVPLYLVHGLENNTMLHDFNVQYRIRGDKARNHLTFSCILTLNQDTNNWLDCMEFSSGLIKARKWGLVNFIKVSSGQINLVI